MVEKFRLKVEDATYEVEIDGNKVLVNGQPFYVKVNGDTVQVDGRPHKVQVKEDVALVDGIAYPFELIELAEEAVEAGEVRPGEEAAPEGAGVVKAIMPGKIIAVNVKPGDRVEQGDVVCILEAMKMENELQAPIAGVVKEVHVAPGDDVEMNQVLVVIE